MAQLRDRYRRSLLAGAVGDALGAPHDGRSWREVSDDLLPDRPLRYLPFDNQVGANTDTTQLLLFTAEGLLRASTRRRADGETDWAHEDVVATVHRALLRWMATQRSDGPPPRPNGWLVGEQALYQRRSRDQVVTRALRSGTVGSLDTPVNNARDGSVLSRVAPIAMASWTPYELARDVAALTHTHHDAAHAAAAFSVVLQKVLVGQRLSEAVESAWRRTQAAGADRVGAAMEAALEAADDGEPSPERAATQAGEHDAVGTLALALFATASTRTVPEALQVALSAGGTPSRSAAAVGLLAGARGVEPLPDVLLDPLELRGIAETMATDLYRHFSGAPFTLEEDEWDRYPG